MTGTDLNFNFRGESYLRSKETHLSLPEWIARRTAEEDDWTVIIIDDQQWFTMMMPYATTVHGKFTESTLYGIRYNYIRIYCNLEWQPAKVKNMVFALTTAQHAERLPLN